MELPAAPCRLAWRRNLCRAPIRPGLLSTAAYRVARRFGEFTDEGNSLSDKPYRLWKISVAALSLPWLITVITFVSTITLHTSGSHAAAANVLWIALVAFLLAVTATSSAMSGDYNGRLFERRRKLKLSEAK